MRVQDPPGVGRQDARPDDPHVPREDDDVRAPAVERLGQPVVVAVRDDRRVDPLLLRPSDRGARPIGDDQDDVAAQLGAAGRRDQRPQVRAGAGHRDRDPAARRASAAHRRGPIGPST